MEDGGSLPAADLLIMASGIRARHQVARGGAPEAVEQQAAIALFFPCELAMAGGHLG
jgi:hypothetical protein